MADGDVEQLTVSIPASRAADFAHLAQLPADRVAAALDGAAEAAECRLRLESERRAAEARLRIEREAFERELRSVVQYERQTAESAAQALRAHYAKCGRFPRDAGSAPECPRAIAAALSDAEKVVMAARPELYAVAVDQAKRHKRAASDGDEAAWP